MNIKLDHIDGLAAGILYGSYAKGNPTLTSDVDLALLFEDLPTNNYLEELRFQLSSQLNKDVDLLCLNTAPTIIASQIYKYGKPLAVFNKKLYEDYLMRLINEYAELKELRKPMEDNLLPIKITIGLKFIYKKITLMKKFSKRIQSKIPFSPSDLDAQDVVILNLQRGIQCCIDLASHIIASQKLGLPASTREIFHLLEKHGWIVSALSIKMQKMVGFRNIAVHDYQTIDPAILHNIIQHHLVDFDDFYQAILKRAKA